MGGTEPGEQTEYQYICAYESYSTAWFREDSLVLAVSLQFALHNAKSFVAH